MKPDSTVYRGRREKGYAVVSVDDHPLTDEASMKLVKHSLSGFEWGYPGSGPAQLALAILLDFTGDPDLSLDCYQRFKACFVADWPEGGWDISGERIRDWLQTNGLMESDHVPATVKGR